MTTKILNPDPIKEEICKDCGKVLRQRRVNLRSKAGAYRIWVHKETQAVECGTKEERDKRHKEEIEKMFKNPFPKPQNHKGTCTCPDCERMREFSGR